MIAGAGPTGLAMAIWLARSGVRVRIIDKNQEPAPYSRALAVQPRTLEFYRQLGFGDEVAASGLAVPGVSIWVDGKRTARVPFSRIGEGLTPYPYLLIFPQDEHERFLLERLQDAGIHVERNTELVSFEQSEGGVHATLRTADASPVTCIARYLAGCDGAHSTVRANLGIGFPGGSYSRLFYVADVEASGATVDRELHIELDESDDLLAVFPLKAQGRVRLVGVIRDDRIAAGRVPVYEDIGKKVIDRLDVRVTAVNWFSSYRVHHRVAPIFRDANVFLAGDAAHIHSPVGGQGMNTGIGDAINLAWKIAAVLCNGAPVTVLDTYESERIPFAKRLVATTDRIFTAVSTAGLAARVMRTVVAPRVLPVLLRLAFARRFFFRTISQLSIRYPDSALSEGAAGTVRAGDRLPWIDFGDSDTFGPLGSRAWHAQLFGEGRPALVETCRSLGLPLFAFPWTQACAKAGLERASLYVIRPDGYVGLADSQGGAPTLRAYLRRHGIGDRKSSDSGETVDKIDSAFRP